MKNVVLLGSTGSIGTSTLKVVEDFPSELRLVGLAAGNNASLLAEQALRHRPALVSIQDPIKAGELAKGLPGIRVASGPEGLLELATLPEAHVVLIAIVGTAGLAPALAAIRAGKDIAVASKEILVMAGQIVMEEARRHGVRVLAVDSEHSAIFQCLDGKPAALVDTGEALARRVPDGAERRDLQSLLARRDELKYGGSAADALDPAERRRLAAVLDKFASNHG
jgi:1-deoxy-D-xylulose-5-phosphate reductoisomerase